MKKIFFVYDDFNEMIQTEHLFKKVGFDTVGISNDSLAEKILGFNPDLVVVCGKDQKFSSVHISQKLKEYVKFNGKVLVGLKKNFKLNPMEMIKMRMDASIEVPIDVNELMRVACHLLGLDSSHYLAKLAGQKVSLRADGHQLVAGKGYSKNYPNLIRDKSREAKYNEIVKSTLVNTQLSSHTKTEIKMRQKELKKGYNFEELEQLDKERLEFAKALLKKDNK